MAINKVINSQSQEFQPVLTDTLVLDAVPTVNSFNSVTSDAVARAIAGASGEVPQVTENDNGKVLTAVYDEGGAAVEWADAPVSLPDMTSQDGKILGAVDVEGTMEAQWINPPESYPSVTGNANKVLTVNAGATGVEWANTQLPEEKSLASTNNTISITEGTTTVSIDVANPLPSTLGTAGQVLTVNSGATGVEWAAPSGGGGDVVIIPLTAAPTGAALETLFNQVDTAVSADKQVVIKTTDRSSIYKIKYFALAKAFVDTGSAYSSYYFTALDFDDGPTGSDVIGYVLNISYNGMSYDYYAWKYPIASQVQRDSFDPFSTNP